MNTLGAALTALRQRQGLSINKFAVLLGRHPDSIAKILAGKRLQDSEDKTLHATRTLFREIALKLGSDEALRTLQDAADHPSVMPQYRELVIDLESGVETSDELASLAELRRHTTLLRRIARYLRILTQPTPPSGRPRLTLSGDVDATARKPAKKGGAEAS